MKKTVLSAVFSCILSLFLALALLAGGLCVYASSTVCSPDLLTDLSRSGGYCEELYEEIRYDWENLLAITGVADPDPIMAVLTLEQVEADTISYITDSYTGSATINTEALEAGLREKVQTYVLSIVPNGEIDEELEKNINELITACISDYKNSVRIPALPKILGVVSKLTSYLTMGLWAAVAAVVVFLAFLFFLQRKRQDTLYFAAISTGTNAVLLLAATGLITHYQIVERLSIDVSALRTLLTGYLLALVNTLQEYGYLFLLITLLLLVAYLLTVVIPLLLQRKASKNETT